jgi:hypothetical protein
MLSRIQICNIVLEEYCNHLHENLDLEAANYFETFCLSIKFYDLKSAKTFCCYAVTRKLSFVRDIQRFCEVHNGHLLKKLSNQFRIERVRYHLGACFCVFTSGSGNRRAL